MNLFQFGQPRPTQREQALLRHPKLCIKRTPAPFIWKFLIFASRNCAP